MKDALNLLEPLCGDRMDFVRQGALIGGAMVLLQQNETKEPKVKHFRKLFADAHLSKGDTMTKLGAIVAAGIIDAGGRNVTISLLSPSGHKKMATIVGAFLFAQFWFWYPYIHFISLAFTPTAVIGLNKDLKMPKSFTFVSNARPSLFAYPAAIELKKDEPKKKVKTATLSVTAKAKARAEKKAKEKDPNAMEITEETDEKAGKDVDMKDATASTDKPKDGTATTAKDAGAATKDGSSSPPGGASSVKDVEMKDASSSSPTPAAAAATAAGSSSTPAATTGSEVKDVVMKPADGTAAKPGDAANNKDETKVAAVGGEAKDAKEKKKEPEPESETLKNPSRVTPSQQQFVAAILPQRYVPVKAKLWGIVVLKDTEPEVAEDFVVATQPKIGVPGVSDDEPDPPAPFQFTR